MSWTCSRHLQLLANSLIATSAILLGSGCFSPSAEGTTEAVGDETDTATNSSTSSSSTPPASSGSGEDDGSGTTGNSEDSGCGDAGAGVCVAVAPSGWQGPVQLQVGSSGASCGAPFDQIVEAVYEDLQASPADCGCSCGDLSVDCGLPQVTQGNPAACTGSPAESIAGPDQCVMIEQVAGCGRGVLAPPTDPQCSPLPSVEVPDVQWGFEGRLCTGSMLSDDGCRTDEVCWPAPETDSACIFREGDHACPPSHPAKRSLFTGVDDTRGCTGCDCAPPQSDEVTCEITLNIYGDGSCSDETTSIVVRSGDGPSADGFSTSDPMSVRWLEPAVEGPSCAASPVSSVGEAAPTGAVTVCCGA